MAGLLLGSYLLPDNCPGCGTLQTSVSEEPLFQAGWRLSALFYTAIVSAIRVFVSSTMRESSSMRESLMRVTGAEMEKA